MIKTYECVRLYRKQHLLDFEHIRTMDLELVHLNEIAIAVIWGMGPGHFSHEGCDGLLMEKTCRLGVIPRRTRRQQGKQCGLSNQIEHHRKRIGEGVSMFGFLIRVAGQ